MAEEAVAAVASMQVGGQVESGVAKVEVKGMGLSVQAEAAVLLTAGAMMRAVRVAMMVAALAMVQAAKIGRPVLSAGLQTSGLI